MKALAKNFINPLLLLIVLASTSGCYTRTTKNGGCCLTGRRPEIMAKQYEWVNDGSPPFGCQDDEEDQSGIIEKEGRFVFEEFTPPESIPVTPEMLDPYQKADTNYHLAIGDELEISVFGDEESTLEKVIIAPDGRIYYGVLKGVYAAGLTIEELRETIVKKVSHLYNNAIVSVIPVVVTAQTYKILGRVRKSGVYFIENSVRLREAIADAGGLMYQEQDQQDRSDTRLDDEVNLKNSFLIRNKKKLDIDFYALINTYRNDQNIFLRPDDYIYIAPMGVREVFVLGNIISPSRVNYYKGLTLMGALAYAGGWTVDSSRSPDLTRVLLIRGELDNPWVSCINVMDIYNAKAVDIILCPGDIIYVNNKTTRFGRELVRLAIYTFVQAYMTGWASYVAGEYIVPLPRINTTPVTGN